MNALSQLHLKQLLKLKQKKFRQEEKKALVEGDRLLHQISEYGIRFDELIINSDDIPAYDSLSAVLRTEAKAWQLEKLSETKNPQSCLAVISFPELERKDDNFLVYLDAIKDPGNLGTIFRTCTAAGISGIILSPDCCEVYNPKVVRSSMGSVFRLPHEIRDHQWLVERNELKVATTLNQGENLFSYRPPAGRMILIIGSEAEGISPEILDHADQRLYIPMNSEMESLNAAIACGILIFYLKQYAVFK